MHAWLAFLLGVLVVASVVILFAASYGVAYYGLGTQALVAIAVVLLVIAGIVAWLLYEAVKAQFVRVKTGKEALIGARGIVTTDINPKGVVRVMSEFWEATAKDTTIAAGQEVEVIGMEGMTLVVKPVEQKA